MIVCGPGTSDQGRGLLVLSALAKSHERLGIEPERASVLVRGQQLLERAVIALSEQAPGKNVPYPLIVVRVQLQHVAVVGEGAGYVAKLHEGARDLCHLLGFRFAPRIKDLKDRKLYAIEKPGTYPLLEPLIGDTVETAAVVSQWAVLMRLKASIQAGTVMPSVILRKLGAAGAGNTLSRALRALGRIERTLFTLQWLSDPELRQRSHAGLNKGEASNSLRRAVFFHRQGEIRDRTFENQSFRASGLSLITAAIVHWNTVYLDRAVQYLHARGVIIPADLLAHVAPLGWEHIALTGDYIWNGSPGTDFRPLREVRTAFLPQVA